LRREWCGRWLRRNGSGLYPNGGATIRACTEVIARNQRKRRAGGTSISSRHKTVSKGATVRGFAGRVCLAVGCAWPVAFALGFHERLVACQGRSLGGVGRFVGSGRVLGPGGALRTGLPFAVLTVLLMTSAGWGPVFRRCSLCCGFDPSSKESACLPRARSHRDTISILRRGLASSAQSLLPSFQQK
jgi:hypothetical protein